jgi:hypothetical protein
MKTKSPNFRIPPSLTLNNIAGGGAALGELLQSDRCLQQLRLFMSRLDSADLGQLAAGLTNNATLTTLELSYNALGGGGNGVRLLSLALKQNDALRTLGCERRKRVPKIPDLSSSS